METIGIGVIGCGLRARALVGQMLERSKHIRVTAVCDVSPRLGVDLKALRLRMILGTALCVGAAVSVCGSIGFVGLVVPHLLRPFVGHAPGKLLGVSALGGAILLLLSDIAVRLIPSIVELKLGVVTSLVGAPFFILLIFQMRRKIL